MRGILAASICPDNIIKGPIVVHQVPEGSITPSTSSSLKVGPLLDFSLISDFLVPRQELCGQLLSLCTVDDLRVVGHPICIFDETKYRRNEFIFNFAVVVPDDCDWSSYQKLVKRVATHLRDAEKQSSLLSDGESLFSERQSQGDDRERSTENSRLKAICEMIFEDLNNYSECMIPYGRFTTSPISALCAAHLSNSVSFIILDSRTCLLIDLPLRRVGNFERKTFARKNESARSQMVARPTAKCTIDNLSGRK